MLTSLRKMKGQSTLEYAILIIIIIGALLTIQTYIKRGVQGRLKSSSDDIGDQFSPGNTNDVKKTTTQTHTSELYGLNDKGGARQGVTKSSIINKEITSTSESAQILNVDQEFWGTKGK
jgi:hypothetical protein